MKNVITIAGESFFVEDCQTFLEIYTDDEFEATFHMTKDELRKKLMDEFGLDGKKSDDIPEPFEGEDKEPRSAPKKPSLFKDPAPKKAGKRSVISYKEITGYEHPAGEFLFPRTILKKADDWDEVMRTYIPETNPNHIPNHDYVLSIIRSIADNKVMMAKGYPGTGKDSTIEWVCSLLKWPVVRVDGAEGKLPGDIVGEVFPDGKGGYVHAEGLLTLFVKYGGVYIDSEPFVNSPAVNMCKQSLLEPKRILNVIGHPDPHKSQIKAVEDFRIFLTTNARGTGDDADKFAATTVQDQSTLNRVDVHCEVDYLDHEQEQTMLMKAFPDMTEELAMKMVKLGNVLRNAWKQGEIEMPFSPRQLFEWADAALKYRDVSRSFKDCYYNSLNEVERGAVKRFWGDVNFHEWVL